MKLAFSKEVAMPMVGVTFASAVSVALVSARILWTGKLRYAFLIWNLFLAWLPFCFALLACDKYRKVSGRHWHFLSLTGAWILFLPNAPYIFTDLIHLQSRYFAHFWVDMVLIIRARSQALVLSFLFTIPDAKYCSQTVGGALVSWCFWLVPLGSAALESIWADFCDLTVGTSLFSQ